MRKDRWAIVIVIIFISSILLFVMNDREKKPEIIKETNLTKIEQWGNSAGVWNKTGNESSYLKCPDDYVFLQEKGTCYKENPLGHTIMTFTQLIASVLTIGLITIYEFKDWRIYLSSKILPYKNRYADELQPIPKSPDLTEKQGMVWVRGGYDALVSGTDNNVYAARKENTAKIGHNLILKGALEKVTAQQLYKYVGYDLQLLREILNNPILKVDKKGRLQEIDENVIIYLALPEKYEETKAQASLKGRFGFGADRFDLSLLSFFKMKKGLAGYGRTLDKASDVMLNNAKQMTETTANISDAVGKTQRAEIESRPRQPEAGSQPQDNERRYQ